MKTTWIALLLLVMPLLALAQLCTAPSGLQADQVAATTARLRWLSAPEASTYVLQYRTAGSGSWQLLPVSDTVLVLTGLTPATAYEAQVRSQCSRGGSSEFGSSVLFQTTALWEVAGPSAPKTGAGIEHVGIGVAEPAAGLHARGGLLLTDTVGLVSAPQAGSHLIWSPAQRAFRVGSSIGSSWASDSIGLASSVIGHGSWATGAYSIALGHGLKADRDSSIMFGFGPVDSLGRPTGDTIRTEGLGQSMALFAGSAIPASVHTPPGKPPYNGREAVNKVTGAAEIDWAVAVSTDLDIQAEPVDPCFGRGLRLNTRFDQVNVDQVGDLTLRSYLPCSTANEIFRKGGSLCADDVISANRFRARRHIEFGINCNSNLPIRYFWEYVDAGSASDYASSHLQLRVHLPNYAPIHAMTVNPYGRVSIGPLAPMANAQLAVGGNMWVQDKLCAKEVNVRSTSGSCPFPDYVFAADYPLLPLNRLKSYIAQHSRLPDMPSAAQVEAEGLELGEVSVLLVKKVEELTLYILEQEARIAKLEAELANRSKTRRPR